MLCVHLALSNEAGTACLAPTNAQRTKENKHAERMKCHSKFDIKVGNDCKSRQTSKEKIEQVHKIEIVHDGCRGEGAKRKDKKDKRESCLETRSRPPIIYVPERIGERPSDH